jgi:hypothetical protein
MRCRAIGAYKEPVPVEGKGYKSMINLPVWKSDPQLCRIEENPFSHHRKNTSDTAFSCSYVPIRDIAVKHAIEE